MHVNRAPSISSGEAARIPLDVRKFPGIRRLAADYACAFPAVAPFFSGDPSDHRAWSEAIARAQAHQRPRGAIATVLADQLARRGAPSRAIECAGALADPQTVAIVTGQQAGLFGGPLYTLLKALTALKLAEQLSRDHHVPAVAIFWVEAEDHDWDEVRSCTVFDEAFTPRTISLPSRSAAAVPVSSIPLDASIQAALDELSGILPSTEFRSTLLEELSAAYRPGTGMADAFARWLEHVLGSRGLVVYDASDPAAKPLARDVFTRELTTAGETAKLATKAGSDLVARGYHSQVQLQEDSLALFRLDGGRRPIRRRNGEFLIGEETVPSAVLVEQATNEPGGFSPNVLLRPVVQDTLFPSVCYVAGPNELAYLGQLRDVYRHFGVPMPLMFPRTTATVLDSAAVRFLTRYSLSLEALQPQDDSTLNELLQAQIPSEVEEAFTGAGHAIDTSVTQIATALKTLDPTLEGAARSTLGRMQHDLETLHGKMIQAAKRRDETLRRQFTRARALAFPDGAAQERAIGFVSFLNQYGPALVDRLDEALPLDLGHHWIVTI